MTSELILAAALTLGAAAEQNPTPQAAGAGTTPAERAAAQEQRRRLTAEIQGFSIILLVGEMQGSGNVADELPNGAKRAITDMREFLPYKRYRVVDSQWTSCCADTHYISLSGRLAGVVEAPPGQSQSTGWARPYRFALGVTPTSGRLQVQFSLREGEDLPTPAPSSTLSRRIEDLRDELVTAEAEVKTIQQRVNVGAASSLELRKAQDNVRKLQREVSSLVSESNAHRSSRTQSVMDSSFTMDIGETVVVGTSRLGGDRALIALVTAAKRNTSAR